MSENTGVQSDAVSASQQGTSEYGEIDLRYRECRHWVKRDGWEAGIAAIHEPSTHEQEVRVAWIGPEGAEGSAWVTLDAAIESIALRSLASWLTAEADRLDAAREVPQ